MALLIVDESMSTRIGTDLRRRGRNAISIAELGLKGLKDPPMLRALATQLDEPFVLVTSDDSMPATHPAVLAEVAVTLATLDTRWERTGLDQEAYKFEVVHRWAHVMAEQKQRTIRRYSLRGHRLWTRPRHR